MSPESIFSLSTNLALASWLLLLVAPRWSWTARFVTSVAVPGLLALAYAGLIAPRLGGGLLNDFGSIAGISRQFQDPHVVVAGWIHYLAFDLFVGSWQVRDSQKLGIGHLWIIPSLALTLGFGPVGLLAYVATRGVLKGRLRIGCPEPHA